MADLYRVQWKDSRGRWHQRRGGYDLASPAVRAASQDRGEWRVIDAAGNVVAAGESWLDVQPVPPEPTADDLKALALEAERRVSEQPTEDLREFWLRMADHYWRVLCALEDGSNDV